MNVKLALILLLLFLILLVLFYNINLESNIVILLGIIIILLVNDLIKRSEYFYNYDKMQDEQILKLDSLLTFLNAISKSKQKELSKKQMEQKYKALPVDNSCIKQITTE